MKINIEIEANRGALLDDLCQPLAMIKKILNDSPAIEKHDIKAHIKPAKGEIMQVCLSWEADRDSRTPEWEAEYSGSIGVSGFQTYPEGSEEE